MNKIKPVLLLEHPKDNSCQVLSITSSNNTRVFSMLWLIKRRKRVIAINHSQIELRIVTPAPCDLESCETSTLYVLKWVLQNTVAPFYEPYGFMVSVVVKL